MQKIILASDVDSTKGLSALTSLRVKTDGVSVGFNASGELTTLGSGVVVDVNPDATAGKRIGQITVNTTTESLYETITTMVKDIPSCSFTFTSENGTDIEVPASLFLSANAGNTLTVGLDGGLYVSAAAALPDDQVLTGDNTGTATVTLTPTTIDAGTANEQVNYTIKVDVKRATTTPSGGTNVLKVNGSNQLYVDVADVTAGQSQTLEVTAGGLLLKNGSTTISTASLEELQSLGGTTLGYLLKI
jgi:hypothetical protein